MCSLLMSPEKVPARFSIEGDDCTTLRRAPQPEPVGRRIGVTRRLFDAAQRLGQRRSSSVAAW